MPNNGNCSIQQHNAPENEQEEEEEEEDRLSSLPDTLLITIISLLPIHSAAATSVLSRRWRYLWTYITHLILQMRHKPFESVVTLINHIFWQLKSPKIHTFYLFIETPRPHSTHYNCSDFMVPWFEHICGRNVESITVISSGLNHFDPFYKIPYCLYQTQSLVQLELFEKFEFNIDYMLSAKFPNLKKLHLVLQDSHIDLISGNHTLFEACPVLQVLKLNLWFRQKGLIANISNPSLICMCLVISPSKLDKIVVDAPKLESFTLIGELTPLEFVDMPYNLQRVDLLFQWRPVGDAFDYTSKLMGLIRGISCVRFLDLSGYAISLFDSISHLDAPPMFRNLIYLSLPGYNNANLPPYLLAKLKRVDIESVACKDVEINLAEHILTHATVLEKLFVSVIKYPRNEDTHKLKEDEFCKKLFMLPKSSANCQIKFFGRSITTSSEHFRDGLLTSPFEDPQPSNIAM